MDTLHGGHCGDDLENLAITLWPKKDEADLRSLTLLNQAGLHIKLISIPIYRPYAMPLLAPPYSDPNPHVSSELPVDLHFPTTSSSVLAN